MKNSNPDTLVTGATGLIGRWLVPLLTQQKRNVMVLMRHSASRAQAYRRWVETHGGDTSRLTFHDLDLGRDDLGLHDIELSDIKDVYHLAARYEFGLTRAEAREVTVLGSLRLLQWCQNLPALRRFVFITGYLAAANADKLRRNPQKKWPSLIDKHYRKSGAYEASKVEENILLQQEAQKLGIPYTVVNPSAVSGDSKTGETTQFIGPCELVRDVYFGKLPALVGGADIHVPLIPVDYVVQFMTHVPELVETEGKSYWLLDQKTPKLPGLVALIGTELGVSYPTKSIPKALVAALPKFITGVEPESLAFLQTHRYDTASADEVAAKMGISIPDFSESFGNWLNYLVSKQFGQNDSHSSGYFMDISGTRSFATGNLPDADVIFLHGMPLDGESWSGIRSALPVPSSSVDLPAHGRNGIAAPQPQVWMEDLMAKNTRKPLLVAHSIGCEFAVRLASAHPEKISGLVLISPYFLQRPAPGYLKLPWLVSLIIKAVGASKFVKMAVGKAFEDQAWFKSAAASLARPAKRQHFAAEMARITTKSVRREVQKMMEGLDMPVTIITGEHDPLLNKFEVTTRHHVIAGSGHYPLISNPIDVASIIEEALLDSHF